MKVNEKKNQMAAKRLIVLYTAGNQLPEIISICE